MVDRLVSVGDDLTLPADVIVPPDRLEGSTTTGRSVLTAASTAAAQAAIDLDRVAVRDYGYIVSPFDLTAANAAAPQVTPTSDSTGQAVHPDVLVFPNGWRGWKYWMGMTPYPAGVNTTENPEILVSNDGDTWQVPPGTTNPIAKPSSGFWPDPDLTYDPIADRLYMVFLGNRAIYTDDGVTWSAPHMLHTILTNEVSPAVIREDASRYVMWSCVRTDTGPHRIIRRVGDSLDIGSTWSAPTDCTYTGMPPGFSPWHIDVARFGATYVALVSVSATNTSGGGGTLLVIGTSKDGMEWTFNPEPLIAPRAGEWDGTDIYRSCLVPASGPGVIGDIWYSGRSGTGGSSVWRTARTKLRWADKDRAPLSKPAVHSDSVSVVAPRRNLLPADAASMLEHNGETPGTNRVGPKGWVNNFWAISVNRQDWDPVERAFALGVTAAGTNLHVPDVPVTGGEWYTFSYWFKSETGDGSFSVHWLDDTKTQIGSFGAPIIAGTGAWQRIVYSGQAPVEAAFAKPWITTATAGLRFLKHAQFELGRVATDWTPSTGFQAETDNVAGLAVYGPLTAAGRAEHFSVGPTGAARFRSVTTANRPAVQPEGSVIYDSTLKKLILSNGTAWTNIDGSALA